MSIHHWTTLGQIHVAGKFPDLQVFSREASHRSIARMKTMMGRSEVISPSHFFSQSEGKYFVRCYENECWYLGLDDIQSLYRIHFALFGRTDLI